MRLLTTYLLVFLFCLTANKETYGQILSDQSDDRREDQTTDQNSTYNVPDTINIQYHYFNNPQKTYSFEDKLLDNIHQIDPARSRNFEYFHLGNIGSSAYPIVFQKRSKLGFYVGQNQYDLYNYNIHNVKIYSSSAPFVNARFSPFGDENTFVVQTDFARKFVDGTSVTINYDRYKQAGSYLNQGTETTNFAGSITYGKNRYKAQLLFISNVNEEQINGGIVDPAQLLLAGYQSRTLATVNLNSASRRNQEKTVLLQKYYRLTPNMQVGGDIGYSGSYYKYSDKATGNSDFYGIYWNDDRGIRSYIKTNTWKLNPYLIFNYKSSNLRLGINYDLINIDNELDEDTKHQIFAFGTGNFQFSKGFSLDYDGRIGLGSATGLFDAKGFVDIDLKNNLKFRGGVNLFRHSPAYQDEKMVVNFQRVWDNDFKNPYGIEFSAKLEIPFLKATLSAQQSTINDAIYYDKDGLPTQYDKTFTALALMASHKLKFWKIHLDNAVAYQLNNVNLYGNPPFYSKHNLYYETKLFNNNLELRLGGQVRIIPSFLMQGYVPATGTFNTVSQKSEFYPRGELYIVGRISKFRMFFKYNNIGKAFQNKVEYNIYNHPLYDNHFRMGVTWMFLN